jgi:hypothetical protein
MERSRQRRHTRRTQNRVVPPFLETNRQTDHLYELVHAFDFNLLRRADTTFGSFIQNVTTGVSGKPCSLKQVQLLASSLAEQSEIIGRHGPASQVFLPCHPKQAGDGLGPGAFAGHPPAKHAVVEMAPVAGGNLAEYFISPVRVRLSKPIFKNFPNCAVKPHHRISG